MKSLSAVFITLVIFLNAYAYSFAGEVPKTAPKSPGSEVGVSTKFSKDKQTLIVTFSNLKKIKTLNYTLNYEASGISEGVVGNIKPTKNNSLTRNIYLGTCSGKVCKPHKKIKNLKLQLKGDYKSKAKINKTLNIKI